MGEYKNYLRMEDGLFNSEMNSLCFLNIKEKNTKILKFQA
jgi:hypothetical protein